MYETAQDKEVHLRRLAAQVIIMLPERLNDAQAVLAYAEEMLRDFITPKGDRKQCARSGHEPPAENITLLQGGPPFRA